ncbi:DNA polymerase V [Kandleria vitulina]|uniref:DNA polymerase V n=1 Tax=Kandleria vitulina TaxID=1630 RepID=A0A1H2T4R5_9FIRM|nr:DNA methylase [Kandleria vitulina]SDW38933.1 DNA polymerase V [Kandleria vitulina]HAD22533.1 DNA methylase [Kandleria vitulina]HBG68096.1 DNA methylase [Kandleria vitulina]HCY53427.1 DNA methylase [Kandleria vitulina]
MKTYLCIDLKSFYASVECVDRGFDPLMTNLVVADKSRTEKTICLAVSPSLKSLGISGRPRLFEVIQKVKSINKERLKDNHYYKFQGSSYDYKELEKNKNLAIDYYVATPRMARYIEVSSKIYGIYLKYIAKEDIHVYSIDEVFIDLTSYLHAYNNDAKALAMKMIKDVYNQTGITATAGIGPNMYLAKVAMDIVAKHMKPDENGVRMAFLDEMRYRKYLWTHRPLTDFWRVGMGYARKLEAYHMYTMGDIARCAYNNEDLLYKLFGVNAELLIDHAFGYESAEMKDIKNYRPQNNSMGSGQVLQCAYDFKKARLVAKEMAERLSLDLVSKHLVASGLVLHVGYDISNNHYKGEMSVDFYGRKMPHHAHGTVKFKIATSSSKIMRESVSVLFDRIVNKELMVRRLNITALNIKNETINQGPSYEQMSLFVDYNKEDQLRKQESKRLEEEKVLQKTMIDIQEKFGKNAALKGMNFEEGATARERNKQIGGHKA